jgi:alkyldihydroxyacetonephosphate synthase
MSRREQVFWGWGEPGAGPELPPHAAGFLRDAFGVSGEVVSPPVSLEDVTLRDSALPAAVRERLAAVCDVRDDRETRVLRCRGKSYLDLLAQRAGECADAPDAVVSPGSHDEVLAVLQICMDAGVAVVPFGGGTSVVGGLEPERGGFTSLVSLDLGRMSRLERIDRVSQTAVFGPGIRLPEAEAALASHGLTLGHFPQSFEWATVGGCVVTRSSGQASTGYGRIEDNVEAVRLAAPVGALETLTVPATAAGPSLKELVVGSEGALGVLTAATLRVRPVPAVRRYEGWFFRSFAEGRDALRAVEQAGVAPDVSRLSDEAETAMSLALAGRHGVKASLGDAVLKARGYAGGCLAITGYEGTAEETGRRRGAATKLLKAAGGFAIGKSAGEGWLHNRYGGPHLRDDLLDRGVLVETLETATTWSNAERLYRAVQEALSGALSGDAPMVMCHVSHLYPTGCSLYFTVIARQAADDPVAQWKAAKVAACDALVANGGTLSHHHAIGRDHAPWLGEETGHLGLDVLRTVKERLDPAGIMNPGVLLPARQGGR